MLAAEAQTGAAKRRSDPRGEIRPLKSIILSSPMQSGELQILKLAKNGTMVKPGDLLVQFDPSTLQRTIQEKQSELKQADAEKFGKIPADATVAVKGVLHVSNMTMNPCTRDFRGEK